MSSNIISLLIALPAVIIAIGFHEAAHAYMAYQLGDNTAKNLGRLTINPLKHIDPIGFIMLFLFHFGWAKPVPINPNNFKNQKWGSVLTALAGPLTNIIIAFIFAIILSVTLIFMKTTSGIGNVLINMVYAVVSVNVCLAVFNMIPIPPLDGSKIFSGVLPSKYYFKVAEYQNIIQLILIMLLFSGVLSAIISPIIEFVVNILLTIGTYIVYYVTLPFTLM